MTREPIPPKLPDGVKLVKSDSYWPDGNWYFIREGAMPLIWNRNDGWLRYYEAVNRTGCHFQSEEQAMEAWKAADN